MCAFHCRERELTEFCVPFTLFARRHLQHCDSSSAFALVVAVVSRARSLHILSTSHGSTPAAVEAFLQAAPLPCRPVD